MLENTIFVTGNLTYTEIQSHILRKNFLFSYIFIFSVYICQLYNHTGTVSINLYFLHVLYLLTLTTLDLWMLTIWCCDTPVWLDPKQVLHYANAEVHLVVYHRHLLYMHTQWKTSVSRCLDFQAPSVVFWLITAEEMDWKTALLLFCLPWSCQSTFTEINTPFLLSWHCNSQMII